MDQKLFDALGFDSPRRKVEERDGHFYVTVIPPKWSGFENSSTVKLNPDQYRRYGMWLGSGDVILEYLPDISSSEREQLVSGITPDDWNNAFGDD